MQLTHPSYVDTFVKIPITFAFKSVPFYVDISTSTLLINISASCSFDG